MKKISIILIALILLSVFISSSLSIYGDKVTEYDYSSMEAEEVADILLSLDKDDLITEVRNAFIEAEEAGCPYSSRLIPFASVLFERINEYPEGYLLDMIMDTEEPECFADNLLSCYSSNYRNRTEDGNNKVKAIINNNKYNDSFRQRAIISVDFNAENTEDIIFLKEIFKDNDDIVAFQALKTLSLLDFSEAVVLADEIIYNYETASPDKLNIAMSIESKYFENSSTYDLNKYNKFIDVCNAVIEDKNADSIVRDSAVFALADVKKAGNIVSILENDDIDDVLKTYAINENSEILLNMLKEDEAYFDLACYAMTLCPIEEFKEPLKKIAMKNDQYSTMKFRTIMNDIDNEVKVEAQTKAYAEGKLTEAEMSELMEESSALPKINYDTGIEIQCVGGGESTTTSYWGYTAYNNNVKISSNWKEWHAALIVSDEGDLIQHRGKDGVHVTKDDWSSIGEIVGIYRPRTPMTTKQRSLVVATANKLVLLKIPYISGLIPAYPIVYDGNGNGVKYEPEDIKEIRCDGVVEFCYEYNGIKIYGEDNLWNITNPNELLGHLTMLPSGQASSMTLVRTTTPY